MLGLDNIWLIYNYMKIWNLRVQKNLNIEKITFNVVQMKFLAVHTIVPKVLAPPSNERFDYFSNVHEYKS